MEDLKELLFLDLYFLLYVYINDLINIKCEGSIFYFTDDRTILIDDSNELGLLSKAIKIMSDVNTWFNANSLEINYSKTFCVPFSISKYKSFHINADLKLQDSLCLLNKNCNNNIKVNCNCIFIKSVDTVQYLDITIDRYLKWVVHIGLTIKKKIEIFFINSKLLIIFYQQIISI